MHLKKLFDLSGRVALVTGGGSGLGLQMARGLAEAGADLAIASRRGALCKEISENLTDDYGCECLPIEVDVTEENQVIAMAERVTAHFGRWDILVNNAAGSIIQAVKDTSLEDWNRILELNLTGTFLCCREAGKIMINQGGGKIINIASVYGLMGVKWKNHVRPEVKDYELLSYTATKGGVINLTRDLAVNWAKYNINVNAVSPGGFPTEQRSRVVDSELLDPSYSREHLKADIPMGRFGEDDDLKGAVVFLASDAGKYMVGHNLVVDGGWSVW